VGDCTEYVESVATAPVPLHVVMAELAGAMVTDLVQGRSRSSLIFVLNRPEHHEIERVDDAADADPLPEDPTVSPDSGPADKPDVEPEMSRE
jgi:hypothetical protein